ncbi:MAG: class B sortase [Clostridia bacterium]|nr:class B sortase [Clostridia bacterium]
MSRSKGRRFADKRELEFSGDNTIQKTKTKKKCKAIYNVIILICLAVIIYSLYNIIVWAIENKKNNDLLADMQNIAGITHEEVVVDDLSLVKTNYDFAELLKRNPDTVGWVYVPNSKIDYPVVQSSDNDFYLNHSFDKSTNSAGWVFADSSCNARTSKNVIIYGHNRKDRSMFGSLKIVQDDEWLSNPQNHYITFANLDESGIYKIFSVFVVNDEHVNSYLETDFSSDEAFKAYLKKIKNSSYQQFDTDIENTESIITLYTCYGANNQRLLVFAAKVL